MNRLILPLLLINRAFAQVPKECFRTSMDTYGLNTGTEFSSLDQLLEIEFDRTMVLNTITSCFGEKGEIFSIQLITKSTADG